MKNYINARKRLKTTLGRGGETLTEVIVSIVLFSLLAGTVIGTMGFCAGIITREKEESAAFNEDSLLAAPDGGLEYADSVAARVSIGFDITDDNGNAIYTALDYELEEVIIRVSEAGLVKWEKP